MKKGGSKQKGSTFERFVAVELSKWISKKEAEAGGVLREDLLWRSSMSGGRATVARKKDKELKNQAGDLSAIHPDGQPFLDKFYIELKSYKDLNFAGILNNTGNLIKFWNSTIIEAGSYKRYPMLIVKQNRLPPIVLIQVSAYRLFKLSEGQAIISSPRNGMYGYLLSDFVKWANPI